MSAVETNAWRRVAFKDISTNTRIITTPDFADYNNLHVVMLLKRGGTQIANDIYFDGVNSGSKYCRLRRTNNTVSQGASENTVDVRGDEENDRYITFDMENWSGEEKILYGHLMIVGDDVEDQQDIQFGAKYVEKSGQINNISVDARSGNTFGSGSYIAVYASTPNSITDEKTTLTNVPVNTRYEETDTRKIYRRVAGGTTSQETQNGGELFNDVEIVSQKFTSGSSKIGLIVDSVDVFIRNDTGSVSTSTNIECKIGQEWSSGVSYGTKSPSALSTSYSWQNFTPASAKRTIAENDRIMIRWADGAVSNDSIRWGSDNNAANQLSNETGEYSPDDGSSGTARSFDRCYKINYSAQWKERGTA